MAACAHGANYASCPPKSVAEEFNQADKGSGILSHIRSLRKRGKITAARKRRKKG